MTQTSSLLEIEALENDFNLVIYESFKEISLI